MSMDAPVPGVLGSYVAARRDADELLELRDEMSDYVAELKGLDPEAAGLLLDLCMRTLAVMEGVLAEAMPKIAEIEHAVPGLREALASRLKRRMPGG